MGKKSDSTYLCDEFIVRKTLASQVSKYTTTKKEEEEGGVDESAVGQPGEWSTIDVHENGHERAENNIPLILCHPFGKHVSPEQMCEGIGL